jgi:hypothetical protein
MLSLLDPGKGSVLINRVAVATAQSEDAIAMVLSR